MRALIIGLVLGGAMAGAAGAQTWHVPFPGTNQIVAPSAPLPDTSAVPTPPPPQSPGLQTGQLGKADGSNDFPRRRPDPGSGLPSHPVSWKGSEQEWTLHSQACAAKYMGYDAHTDRYPQYFGVTSVRCPASVR